MKTITVVPGGAPSQPADQSLNAYKIWLTEQCRLEGVALLETDLTPAEWEQSCAKYWTRRGA